MYHLNYEKEDYNYILLGEIFKIIRFYYYLKKIIASQKKWKTYKMFVLSIKNHIYKARFLI
jgi:thymidylate synthase